MENIKQLNQESLIRSIAISPKGKYMLLLGAGASASSGIPTASQCIWEWKREIYLSGNSSVSPSSFLDVTLPTVQRNIQRWLDQKGNFPRAGNPDEYGFYVSFAYPKSEDRRTYFEKRFSGAVPQAGYHLLAKLLNSLLFQWVWTTNFDNLIVQARLPKHTRLVKEIGLDTAYRLQDLREDESSIIKVHLHGDYRYDSLQNTDKETAELDEQIRAKLVERVSEQALIVLGYSGRDKSVMNALEKAIVQKAQGGEIYWCLLQDEKIPSQVLEFLEKAKENSFPFHIIEINGFDDFIIRLARFYFRDQPDVLDVEEILSSAVSIQPKFSFSGYQPDPDWLKSNGYPIELPRELYQFDTDGISEWEQLRQMIGNEPIAAGIENNKVLAIGSLEKLREIFSKYIKSKIERTPIESDPSLSSIVYHILLFALQLSLAEATGLKLGSRGLLWDPSKFETRNYQSSQYKIFRGVRISLDFVLKQCFVNFIPDIFIIKNDERIDRLVRQEIKRQVLGRQWNQAYHDELEFWRKKFLEEDDSRLFQVPSGDSENGFSFKISRVPAYSRILVKSNVPAKPVRAKRGEIFKSVVVDEPKLIFGSSRGHPRPLDPHPIRGLVNEGPYELQLSQETGREISLGVICPQGYEGMLSNYLKRLLVPHPSIESKPEYLLGYPGFANAYRVPLKVPMTKDVEWRRLPNIPLNPSKPVETQRKITEAITRGVDTLSSATSVDVIVIFIPSNWKSYETLDDEHTYFDLHDYVKAHCVQKGVRTQLLRQETVNKGHQCEVLWWISQALYVKSLRTPFVLDTTDVGTVFVGIGYGFSKRSGQSGVVLGCSHIYDAAGQGLRYQLSKISDPIWANRNPFLSKDDAIRVGLQARQLFHDIYHKLPKRVVIHKRTPFLQSEIDGFSQALKGVNDLELLTFEYERAWRFIAYNKYRKSVDLFPVKRGTVLLMEDYKFLLWVHGTTRGFIENNRSYFQGKSRIPTPLRITRFAGSSSIESLATETLGLSKMDWNSYDLYSQMPATLETSGAIARIGQLISRFGSDTYDYRLFM